MAHRMGAKTMTLYIRFKGLVEEELKELNFPKSFSVTKAEKRKKRLWDKEEVKDWIKTQRNEKVT